MTPGNHSTNSDTSAPSPSYRPFRDICAAQGLLLLDVLFPFYLLFGGTLGAIRLGVGLLSMLGLIGAWWSGRLAAGPIGGLAAVFLLVASPAYLEGSRLALAEVPSLVPCLFAIGCGLRWQRGGGPRWLYAAAALATGGVLVKPMAISVAAPLGLLMLLRPGVRRRQVAIALGVALGITVVVVLIMGPAQVYEQIVLYRVGAREGGTWEFRRNFKDVLMTTSGPCWDHSLGWRSAASGREGRRWRISASVGGTRRHSGRPGRGYSGASLA